MARRHDADPALRRHGRRDDRGQGSGEGTGRPSRHERARLARSARQGASDKQAMSWRKIGLIYAPDGSKPWMRAYAANPTAEPIGGDRFRVYFSSRDDRNRSSISFVEIDLN